MSDRSDPLDATAAPACSEPVADDAKAKAAVMKIARLLGRQIARETFAAAVASAEASRRRRASDPGR